FTEAKRGRPGSVVSAGGIGGPPRLRRPSRRRKAGRTVDPPLAGSLGPSSSRFWCPGSDGETGASSLSWNKSFRPCSRLDGARSLRRRREASEGEVSWIWCLDSGIVPFWLLYRSSFLFVDLIGSGGDDDMVVLGGHKWACGDVETRKASCSSLLLFPGKMGRL
ncbi:unnamed protein product, partial [Urochloa humidicola]